MGAGQVTQDSTAVLGELYELVGQPGVRVVQDTAGLAGALTSLSKATVSNLLNGRTNPRRSSVEAFVLSCLHHARTRRTSLVLPEGKDTPGYWMRRYDRAARTGTPASSNRPPERMAAPSHLLDSNHEVVPYRDRRERKTLECWRDDSSSQSSVLLLHGRGGQGKTRLASRFAADSAERGWLVVQAHHRDGALKLPSRIRRDAKLLVVVDYVERWTPDALVRTLEVLSAQGPHTLRRILLLARSDDVWGVLEPELSRSTDCLVKPLLLGPFTQGDDDLDGAFNEAVFAFQQAIGLPPEQLPPPDKAETGRSPLELHFAALAAVCARQSGQPVPADDLSAFLLSHERSYWLSGLKSDQPIGSVATQLDRFARVVFTATLFGPFARAEYARNVLRAAHAGESDADIELLLDWHAQLYPQTDSAQTSATHLVPLGPDRFAEDFVASHLLRPRVPELLTELLVSCPATRDDANDGYIRRRAVALLSGASDRHSMIDELLEDVQGEVPELFAYINSKGFKYYPHRTEVVLRGGKPQTIYFFAKVERNAKGKPARIPRTRVVKENLQNGFLTISKKRDLPGERCEAEPGSTSESM
ncbi:hypothetical protein ACFT0G_15635 [Streptomyces sp. NPDC057020]|uniref:hypothetical protein n=1 Tax=unclassified Streptomyces TaxID=2593676 RepID=UPI00363DF621